jgi:predicted outer membrane repeat protein/parallel beta-helix repeat protein
MSPQFIRRWIVSVSLVVLVLAAISLSFSGSARVRASGGGTAYPGSAPCATTLQACIDGLSDGDRIDITAGTYTESFTLDKAVSLKGDGLTTTLLIAANLDRVLTVTGAVISNSVKISGLTFQGGNLAAGVGGGIFIDNGAQPDIRDIALIGNHASQGGGLYASLGSTLTLESISVLSNSATNFGGGLYVDSKLTISNSLIQNNTGSAGGGLYANAKLEMELVQVISNSANTGGGVFVNNGEVYVEGGSFEQNVSTSGPGGGLNMVSGEAYLNYPTFNNNAAYSLAGDGGGAYFGSGYVGVMGGSFQWNHADGRGGALNKIGSEGLDVAGVCFSDNSSSDPASGGGAIHSTSVLTVAYSCFDSNSSANRGGAIFANSVPLLVSQSKFVNNQADSGGGIYMSGAYNGRIENSLFARNPVTTTGTAMALDSLGVISVTHNTIGDVIINPSPAIAVNAGFVSIQDTIVASHSTGISLTGGIASQDYNLFFHDGLPLAGSIVNGGHSLNGQDPRFYDSANDDYHLTTGSAAINSGVDAGVHIDYDWDSRPLLGAFDIGYDETYNGLSTFSIQAAINAANPILTPTVFIPPGVYVENLTLNKPVNLMGNGSSNVFIYGNGSDRVLTVTVPSVSGTIVISGLTFAEGDATYAECGCGGSVLITDTTAVMLNDVVITGSVARSGGGLAVFKSNVGLSNGTRVVNNLAQAYFNLNHASQAPSNGQGKGGGLFVANANVMLNNGAAIEGNVADFGGGVYLENNVLNMFGGSINDNQAYVSGGGVYIEQGNAAMHKPNGVIAHNQAYDGAGVFVQDGQFDQTGGDVFNNVASNWGGGVLAAGATSSVKLNGGKILSNSAYNGGGVFIDSGSVDFSLGLIVSNTAIEGGGAFIWGLTAMLTQSVGSIVSNTAINGGGVAVTQGRFKLMSGLIAGNVADFDGGAIFLNDSLGRVIQSGGLVVRNRAEYGGAAKIVNGQYYMINGQIGSNQATNSGGGVFVHDVNAAFNLIGGSIDNNSAYDGGGVVVNMGSASFVGGLISSNVVTGSGGGLYVYSSGAITLTNTDILSNTAGGPGGGLYAEAPITLTTARFRNNNADTGGGLYALSDAHLLGGYFLSNNATGDGGGLEVGGELSITAMDLISNTAGGYGGAICVENPATLKLVNVNNNMSGAYGGGIYASGPLTVTTSSFEGNSAGSNGGGAYVGGIAYLSNTLMLSNTAVTGNGGGLSGWAAVVAVNSSFIANQCDDAACEGGGLYTNYPLVLTNTDFLSNTSAYNGGGAWADGDVWVTGGKFNNNDAPFGGGAALGTNSNVTLTNVSFIGNDGGSSTSGGAVWVVNGSAQVSGGSFLNNTGGYGGAIAAGYGMVTASGTAFITNQADSGGAIYANASDLNTAYLQGNQAVGVVLVLAPTTSGYGSGGGVAAATTIITNSTFINNQSVVHNGGGVYATDLTVDNTDFTHNQAGYNGGGVYVENSVASTHNTFTGNTSQSVGGALAAVGQVAVTFTKFISNSAGTDGGAIYGGYNVSAVDSLFDNNIAATDGAGGAVYVKDSATLLRDLLTNNHAAYGGGVYANTSTAGDQVAVSRSKFIGNQADEGGGLYHTGLGSGSIVNSLFARNQAVTEADGLSLNSTGAVSVFFSTLANPISSTHEAIVVNAGTVNVTNTIVASYSIGLKQTGGSVVEDYNLYFGNNNNQIGAVTQLGNSLGNANPLFGKPSVDDYHLSLFSPAVDTALNLGVTNDLGGWPRPMGSGFDRGAFELQAQTTNVGQNTGGQLTYVNNQGFTTTVLLPPGLVTTNTTIIFNNLNGESITSTPPSGLMFSGKLFDLDAFLGANQIHNITFTKPVTIVIQYSDADLAGIDEDSLRVYRFETTWNGVVINDWRPIGFRPGESQVLDVDNNTLTVVLRGFSRFAKLGSDQFYEVFLPLVMK